MPVLLRLLNRLSSLEIAIAVMLLFLLVLISWFLIRITRSGKSVSSKWEMVGINEGPDWLTARLNKIRSRDPLYFRHLSYDENKYLLIKGKHYRYRITGAGQNGDPVVERQLRHRFTQTSTSINASS